MRTLKGPGLLLSQYIGPEPPFNSVAEICKWARGAGFEAVQFPAARLIDIEKAAASQTYCDELLGQAAAAGVVLSDMVSHIQGQLCAVHPGYDSVMDQLAPPEVRGDRKARQQWAIRQLKCCATASRRLRMPTHATFSGALLWPYCYPFPHRPQGLVEDGFAELARIWRPILDHFDAEGVDLCFELHPMEDLFDGVTFERFLEAVGNHPRCHINYDPSHFIKQGLNYVEFIDIYHERIRMFHVKDAEFRPDGRQGFYSGYLPWMQRAARDRSLGHGQVDFRRIFSKMAQYDFANWAVFEWHCCLEHPETAAKYAAHFIREHIIHVADQPFEGGAAAIRSAEFNRRVLGLD